MNWYEDKEYHVMCEEAVELQAEKYKKGWNEGDRIWDGNSVKVIGFDFISISKRALQSPVFYFAVLQNMEPKIVYEQDYLKEPIEAKTGTYKIMEYANPVWLPSQEDLAKIYCEEKPCTWSIFLNDFKRWLFKNFQSRDPQDLDLGIIHAKFSFEVQLKLAFVMHELYGKVWDPETKKWEEEP